MTNARRAKGMDLRDTIEIALLVAKHLKDTCKTVWEPVKYQASAEQPPK